MERDTFLEQLGGKKNEIEIKKPAKPKKKTAGATNEPEGQLTIDVYQTPTEIVIQSTIAGVPEDELDITITNDMVTIRGRRERGERVEEDGYFYQECFWGSFSRSIILPVEVEANEAKATLKNGLLTIRLPKAEKIKTKKIVIRAEA